MMHIKLAYAYHHLKLYDQALKECAQAINLAADDPNMQYSRAFIYQDMKEFDKMQADFENAVSREPSFDVYKYYYAQALLAMGEKSKALDQIKKL